MKLLSLLLAVLLTACAALGVSPADTFNKKLAAGYQTVHVVAEVAVAARNAGKLKPEEVAEVIGHLESAVAGLDAARGLSGTDIASADARLTSAIAILSALQSFLATRSPK